MTSMTNVDLDGLAALPYALEILPEEQPDGSVLFMATHPELPGCMAHGVTVEEAVEDLAVARRLYLSALVDRGLDVPRPHIRRAS